MRTKKKSGQVLILVLLVVVVSLAIGLSVASRNLSNLKISSQTDQSQRAYSVAENGVENVLAQLNNATLKTNISNAGSAGYPIAGPADSAGNASSTTIVSKSTYERQIAVGEVGQIDLSGAGSTSKYTVMWAKASSLNECVSPASLEVTFVYRDGASLETGNYVQRRWYLPGSASSDSGRSETFTIPENQDSAGKSSISYNRPTAVGSGACATGGSSPSPAPSPLCSTLYINCATIDTTTANSAFPSIVAGNRILLRIRPLWADTTVNVGPNGGSLPPQGYDITSSATVGNGVTRKLLVQKSALPSVPAVFDFALYSEQDILK